MGSIEKTVCKVCDSFWQYKTGCGINHWNLDVVLPLFSQEKQLEIKAWAHDKVVPQFCFEYARALCENCSGMVSVPTLTLLPESIQYVGNCEHCDSQVSLVKHINMANCPKCGSGSLENQREGLWD